MSLEALAEASGVSRSMISVVERGESSPTAVVLDKLANSLGVTLATLFEEASATVEPVSRRCEQTKWRDPVSGYMRRAVSPAGWPSPVRISEIEFPGGAQITYEPGARGEQAHQQIWILSGAIEVMVGDRTFQLCKGDCLACTLDHPITFRNSGTRTARYAVVTTANMAATE